MHSVLLRLTLLINLLLGEVRPGRAQSVIQGVFDRLTLAFANNRPPPQLVIIPKSLAKTPVIIQYVPGNRPVVRMDAEVYDLCRTLGRDSLNALAVLLGHELAHHYEKHDWAFAFGVGMRRPSGTGNPDDLRRLEAEADFYGCFYGELAGYTTGATFPRVLDLLYKRYRLADNLPGYLSRTERKAVYRQKQREALDLAGVFRAGQVLYLLKEYEPAVRCFDLLTNRFPSREMFASLSATLLQQALSLGAGQTNGEPAFAYPVELDARSRLSNVSRSSATAAETTALLQRARQNAEKARAIEPTYVPASVNLACAQTLLGNYNAAIGVINDLPAPALSGDAHTIRAIALYRDGQPARAGEEFTLARARNGYLADYNADLFAQLERPLSAGVSQWIQEWFGNRPDPKPRGRLPLGAAQPLSARLAAVPTNSSARPVLVSDQPYVRVQAMPGSLRVQTGSKTYHVVNQAAGWSLRPAMSAQEITNQYGAPTYERAGADGRFWVYRDAGLILFLNTQHKLTNWMHYTVSI